RAGVLIKKRHPAVAVGDDQGVADAGKGIVQPVGGVDGTPALLNEIAGQQADQHEQTDANGVFAGGLAGFRQEGVGDGQRDGQKGRRDQAGPQSAVTGADDNGDDKAGNGVALAV